MMMTVSSVQQLVCSVNAAMEAVGYKYTLSLDIDAQGTIASAREHCNQHILKMWENKETVFIYIHIQMSARLNGIALQVIAVTLR